MFGKEIETDGWSSERALYRHQSFVNCWTDGGESRGNGCFANEQKRHPRGRFSFDLGA